MFRALLCSSPGGQNCIIQHLVSSHSLGGRPVHRIRICTLGWTVTKTNLLILPLVKYKNSVTIHSLDFACHSVFKIRIKSSLFCPKPGTDRVYRR